MVFARVVALASVMALVYVTGLPSTMWLDLVPQPELVWVSGVWGLWSLGLESGGLRSGVWEYRSSGSGVLGPREGQTGFNGTLDL